MEVFKRIEQVLCVFIVCTCTTYGQWIQVNSGTNILLHDLFLVDSTVGYCVGGGDVWGSSTSPGGVLKTTDGGSSWNSVYFDSLLSLTEVVANENKVFCF